MSRRQAAYLDDVARINPLLSHHYRKPRSDLAISDHAARKIKWGFEHTLHEMSKQGKRLRQARTTAMLSMEQLAEKSGVPLSHIALLEAGKIVPTADDLILLLRALLTV